MVDLAYDIRLLPNQDLGTPTDRSGALQWHRGGRMDECLRWRVSTRLGLSQPVAHEGRLRLRGGFGAGPGCQRRYTDPWFPDLRLKWWPHRH